MKISNFCCYIVGIIFALMPLLLLVTYLTYSEKIVFPILIFIMIICFIIAIFADKKNK